ncbi:MAG: SGNH/GDSL hydrolase family protein [Spirochaetales bacterium]|nr:SGNH/GDSL hydrolase family protein [Spirochaetales bacterium]
MKSISLVLLTAGLCLMLGNVAARDNWVTSWASAQQLTEPHNMPPKPGLTDATLRQAVHASIGGKRIRLRFSNEFGNGPVTVNAAAVAVYAGNGAIKPKTSRPVLFNKSASVTIAPKEAVYSDPLAFTVDPLAELAVTIAFGEVPKGLTGHPGSRTISYFKAGAGVADERFDEPRRAEHWYILSAIDVMADAKTRAIVCLGDSLTDGRGSTTNRNNRWTDNLSARLRANKATKNIAVVNMGIGGNAVYSGGLGPTAAARFDRDVLGIRGVKWVIVLAGVNDIGGASKKGSPETADRLIASFKEFAEKAHAAGLKIYGIPILPFGGSQYANEEHEAARVKVNEWMKTSGAFDAYLDVESAVADPSDPKKLARRFDSNDHLHLSPKGYQALADAIDLKLFK